MSDQSKKHRLHLRTFAGDISVARGEKEITVATPKDVVRKKKTPAPIETNIIATPVTEKPTPSIPKPPPALKPNREHITATEKSVVEKPAPQAIPAFHEIQKQVNEIKRNSQGGNTAPTKNSIGLDSTIITDTKTNDYKVVSSVINSIEAWFKKVQRRRKQKAIPKFSVPETKRRKGVIQKATSKSGTIFTGKNDDIKDRIRQRQQAAELPIEKEPTTIWSPFTETTYNLLEVPDLTQNVVTKPKQNSSILLAEKYGMTKIPKPEIYLPVETEQNNQNSVNLGAEKQDEHRWSSQDEEKVSTKESSSENTLKPDIARKQTNGTEKLIPNKKPVPLTKSEQLFKDSQTNTLTLTLLIIIVSLIALVYGAKVAFKYLDRPTEPEKAITITPVLQNTTILPVTLNVSDVGKLTDLIKSSVASSPAGMVELSLISPAGTEVSPAYIFNLLKLNTAPILEQSLTTVRFVSIDQNNPSIIIKFIDTNTIKGSFFSWETSMFDDLRGLYSIPEDIDPTFSDENILNTDVRIIRHNEEAVLFYSIISADMAIISNNIKDFEKIITAQSSQ